MIRILLLIMVVATVSCSSEEKKPAVIQEEESLVEISNGKYTEYYPGKKKIKFQGTQDDEKRRHGKWVFFDENGTEISTTFYDHGKKHGHSIVKYPTGVLYYYGEYHYDKMIGVWKTYDEKGKLVSEKDYGQPE